MNFWYRATSPDLEQISILGLRYIEQVETFWFTI